MNAVSACEHGAGGAHVPGSRPARIGIFYHADPVGHVPGGIGTVIRGILKWAPEDLEYTLYGATTDPRERPIGRELHVSIDGRPVRYVPLVGADPTGARTLIPLTLRYVSALRQFRRSGALESLDILDFHRIEALALFRTDARPKNVMIHQDMDVIRSADSDIAWRHAPWLYELIEPRLLRRVDRVFCVRQTAVMRYRRIYPGLADRFTFMPTWVDTSVFRPPSDAEQRRSRRQDLASRYGSTAKLLVWVGRLDRQKDPMLLLDAVKALADTRQDFCLLTVGDGSLREKVESRIRRLGLEARVRLLGALPPARIAALLQAADLFVLSSAYEGMPIAVLEALAAGVPVVSTDVGEVRLVVRDGVNGFVVRERAARALAQGMSDALRLGDAIRGAPCEQSVSAYVPERVLGRIFDNHRRQARTRTR